MTVGPGRTLHLRLGLVLVVLGLWLWATGIRSSRPLPASEYLGADISIGILITLGLVVVFLGRIPRIVSPAKEKTTD